MKKTKTHILKRAAALVMVLALALSAMSVPALAAGSNGLVGGFFVTGDPAFAYIVTYLTSSGGTVKLYQDVNMQSYAGYSGDIVIPATVYSAEDLRTYAVTELSAARGTQLGALENVSLSRLILPHTITTIGSKALAGCGSLYEVTLPTSVRSLASNAFFGSSLSRIILDVSSDAALYSNNRYTPKGQNFSVTLPVDVSEMKVSAVLTVIGSADVPGDVTLSGGRITLQSGSSLTLGGDLTGAGVIEVGSGAELTLSSSTAAYTGTIRLSTPFSQINNNSRYPVTVNDTNGRPITVAAGETVIGEKPVEELPGADDKPGDDETPVDPETVNYPRVSATEGGVVTVQDGGKTVVITANDGYYIADVVINGLSMGKITRYEFQTATYLNTVSVVFAEGQVDVGPLPMNPILRFKDVPMDAPYASAVRLLVNNGIFQGVGSSTFAPDMTVSRGMLASLLKRMEVYGGEFEIECEKPVYVADLIEGEWYTEPAAWALGTKLMSDTFGYFLPEDEITRLDLALALARMNHLRGYATYVDAASYHIYSDISDMSEEAQKAMVWTCTSGFISGKGRLTRPDEPVTRAEIASALAKYLLMYS